MKKIATVLAIMLATSTAAAGDRIRNHPRNESGPALMLPPDALAPSVYPPQYPDDDNVGSQKPAPTLSGRVRDYVRDGTGPSTFDATSQGVMADALRKWWVASLVRLHLCADRGCK